MAKCILMLLAVTVNMQIMMLGVVTALYFWSKITVWMIILWSKGTHDKRTQTFRLMPVLRVCGFWPESSPANGSRNWLQTAKSLMWIPTQMPLRRVLQLFYNGTRGKSNGRHGRGMKRARKPGRPRVIIHELEPVVVELYQQGYGYRAIANILRQDHGINLHFSSVRKTLIRLGTLPGNRLWRLTSSRVMWNW